MHVAARQKGVWSSRFESADAEAAAISAVARNGGLIARQLFGRALMLIAAASASAVSK